MEDLNFSDLLITIENDVKEIIYDTAFGEFNNKKNRTNVRNTIENYLENIKQCDRISDYEVVMDESNNTLDIIDANSGIVDIMLKETNTCKNYHLQFKIVKNVKDDITTK